MSRVDGYARSILELFEAENPVGEASDELFRFSQAVSGNEALRAALVDESKPLAGRLSTVEDLLAPALRVTRAAVTQIVAAGRANELREITDRVTELAAAARDRQVAEVRSAVPLDDATINQLAAALSHATGKQVEVKVIVDEKVLGGIVARVGDTVIDGTVRHKLEQMREAVR